MADESFLTPREVAAELRCSESAVRRAIRDGRLQAVEVGERTRRVPVAEFRRFVTKSAAGGAGTGATGPYDDGEAA